MLLVVELIMITLTFVQISLALTIKSSDECLTPHCLSAANYSIQLMDPTVDPCHDFYDFACGRFIKEVQIPSNRVSISPAFTDLNEKVRNELIGLLQEPIGLKEAQPIAMAKKYFTDCMDNETREAMGSKPLLELIEKMGGWPMLSGSKTDFPLGKWWQFAEKFESAGVRGDHLIRVIVGRDLKQKNQSALYLSPPSFPTNLELNILNRTKLIFKVLKELGATNERRLADETDRVIKFILELKSIKGSQKGRYYNSPFTLDELQKIYSFVNWTNYINSQLPQCVYVNLSSKVIVQSPFYVRGLGELLRKTEDRVVANFMVWRVVHELIPFANQKLVALNNNYVAKCFGRLQTALTNENCLRLTRLHLSLGLDALYVRNFFDSANHEAVAEIVNRVQNTLDEILRSDVQWMDPRTKTRAQAKLSAMGQVIGYPEQLLDDASLEDIFDGVNIQNQSFFEENYRLSTWKRMKGLAKLKHFIDSKQRWVKLSAASIDNAFYIRSRNSILLNAAILQGRFFSLDRPNYVNYATIGSVIGHEINHGFDSMGRHYDEHGNLADWWEPITADRYTERSACLHDQYAHFIDPVTLRNVNANLSLGEDIADNEGVRLAYKAYQQLAAERQPELRLPYLGLSTNQIFWLSFGQLWCTKQRSGMQKSAVRHRMTDPHTTARFRVIGSLRNSRSFAKDFNCTIGSPMNPEKKCSIW